MKLPIALAFLLAASVLAPSQTISLRVRPIALAGNYQLLCTEHYDRQDCTRHVAALSRELAKYPARALGRWQFVLVPETDWAYVVRALQHDPATPAFTILDARVTVLESSLFAPSYDRRKQLLEQFGLSGKPLLDLAITHEMAHGLCMERDERRADELGRRIRAGQPISCREPAGALAEGK